MAQKIPIYDFKNYLSEQRFCSALYLTENQEWFSDILPVRNREEFNEISVFDKSGQIMFRNDKNYMSLSLIDYIECDNGASILGSVLKIVCADHSSKSKHRSFTFILR